MRPLGMCDWLFWKQAGPFLLEVKSIKVERAGK
jgi:hypothetical protein